MEVFSFIYKADVGQGLIEHELDHVFIGVSDNKPVINREEVESCKYVNLSWLISDIEDNPKEYTEWFKIIYQKFLVHVRHESNS